METVTIEANGHPNIRATHDTTWQLTKEGDLTPKGDCIIGLNAEMSASELPEGLKSHIQSGKKVLFEIKTTNYQVKGRGFGNTDLELTDDIDMVFRQSDYVCERTILQNCNIVAADLPRVMVKEMQNTNNKITTILKAVD